MCSTVINFISPLLIKRWRSGCEHHAAVSVIMFTGTNESYYLYILRRFFDSVNVFTETGNVGLVVESSINYVDED